jgi:hypothetical protein
VVTSVILCPIPRQPRRPSQNLWRALTRLPASALVSAAASWQAKQVAVQSSPQLLEKQRDCIRTVLHFMLRVPLLMAFSPTAAVRMPPFELVPSSASPASSTLPAASSSSSAALSSSSSASSLSPSLLSLATGAQCDALFAHVLAHTDERVLALCRMLTRAFFHTNAEAVLHILFLYLADVAATIMPPDALVLPDAGSASSNNSSGSGWVRHASQIPLSVRQQCMRAQATRLVHDVALLQYSHQAASLHLLLSHAIVALPTPDVHAQPLLGFLLAFRAPKQGGAAGTWIGSGWVGEMAVNNQRLI